MKDVNKVEQGNLAASGFGFAEFGPTPRYLLTSHKNVHMAKLFGTAPICQMQDFALAGLQLGLKGKDEIHFTTAPARLHQVDRE